MIDIPFANNNPVLKKIDDLMVEVGNHLFEAENMLTSFIYEIIIANDNAIAIEIELSDHLDAFRNITVEGITWNEERRSIEVHTKNNNEKIIMEWGSLPISMKNLIANFIHLKLLSNEIYGNLS